MSRALDSGNSPGGRSPYLPNVTSCAERFEAGESFFRRGRLGEFLKARIIPKRIERWIERE